MSLFRDNETVGIVVDKIIFNTPSECVFEGRTLLTNEAFVFICKMALTITMRGIDEGARYSVKGHPGKRAGIKFRYNSTLKPIMFTSAIRHSPRIASASQGHQAAASHVSHALPQKLYG